MNSESILQELKAERERVDIVISALEPLVTFSQVFELTTTSTRQPQLHHGRSAESRARQSRRMKQIWAERRAG